MSSKNPISNHVYLSGTENVLGHGMLVLRPWQLLTLTLNQLEAVLRHFSHVPLSVTLWPARLLCPWDSPGKNTGVGCHSLLQRIFPTQESNLHLLYLLHWQAGFLLLALPRKASLVVQMVKNLPSMRETQIRSLGWEDFLEKEMATYSYILENSMDREAWQSSQWGWKESYTTEWISVHSESQYWALKS